MNLYILDVHLIEHMGIVNPIPLVHYYNLRGNSLEQKELLLPRLLKQVC